MAKRLLIIDDNEGYASIVARYFVAVGGYEVETACCGAEGLEKASRMKFDVVLADMMLPDMDGCDVARELERKGVESPVAILSGYEAQKVIKWGMAKSGLPGNLRRVLSKSEKLGEILVKVNGLSGDALAV
ncbi:MAG: response regulator [Elusimicrobia bacterium]|nr:response regulator [Elusimicrobiota bacterium]